MHANIIVICRVTFIIAFLLLLTGAALNDQRGRGQTYFGDYCFVVKAGVFAGGAVLSLASVSLGITYYVALSFTKSIDPWGLHNNQGIALGQPQRPPQSTEPVFVHEDTYNRQRFPWCSSPFLKKFVGAVIGNILLEFGHPNLYRIFICPPTLSLLSAVYSFQFCEITWHYLKFASELDRGWKIYDTSVGLIGIHICNDNPFSEMSFEYNELLCNWQFKVAFFLQQQNFISPNQNRTKHSESRINKKNKILFKVACWWFNFSSSSSLKHFSSNWYQALGVFLLHPFLGLSSVNLQTNLLFLITFKGSSSSSLILIFADKGIPMVFDLTGLICGRAHDLETHVLILALPLFTWWIFSISRLMWL